MNTALRESIRQADGRYLTDAELQPLHQYLDSFAVRFHAYTLLQEHHQTLVVQALRQLARTHRPAVVEHGEKCKRDMAYTLECVAQAVLLDDALGFHDGYLIWMQNITRSLHKQDSAIQAYRFLQAEVSALFPANGAQLVNHYLEELIQAFAEGR